MTEKIIKVVSYLTQDEAEAGAEFFKRAGLSDYADLAINEDQAYWMQSAARKFARALADNGFNPR